VLNEVKRCKTGKANRMTTAEIEKLDGVRNKPALNKEKKRDIKEKGNIGVQKQKERKMQFWKTVENLRRTFKETQTNVRNIYVNK
jgi:hypothetical protein